MFRAVSRLMILAFLICAVLLVFSCSKNPSGDDVDDDNNNQTPPAAIDDLHATIVTTTTIILEWTAPGSDGNTGCAAQYDLRASYDSITTASFSSADHIDSIVVPIPAGNVQNWTIDSLEDGQTYYFAIKTRDMEGNWSAISNCPRVTCSTDAAVTFPDSVLERVIRTKIGKPAGDIYRSDVDTITELQVPDEGISDLTGIENLANLSWLNIFNNNVSNLSPLSGMMSLLVLHMNMNDISDLTPIAGLTNLDQLTVGQNPITNLTPLSGLTKLHVLRLNDIDATDFSPIYGLTQLWSLDIGSNLLGNIAFVSHFTQVKELALYGNAVSDISILAGMTNLEVLTLTFNQISDLSPLTGLTHLRELGLSYNQIIDLQPLVDNNGLGSGDQIYLSHNPLSDTATTVQIPALQARGATVIY